MLYRGSERQNAPAAVLRPFRWIACTAARIVRPLETCLGTMHGTLQKPYGCCPMFGFFGPRQHGLAPKLKQDIQKEQARRTKNDHDKKAHFQSPSEPPLVRPASERITEAKTRLRLQHQEVISKL
jgi:hypothetical protein